MIRLLALSLLLAGDDPPAPAAAAQVVDISPILPAIVGCARTHLAAEPHLAAQLRVHLAFAEGRISAATMRIGEIEHPALSACLGEAALGQALAHAPEDGRVILSWPYR